MARLLKGDVVTLRPLREADLDLVWAAHIDLASRGPYFPLNIISEPDFKRRFAESGFWEKTEGMLLITVPDDRVLGHIEFFVPVSYWDAFELSYQLYDPASAGHGYVTEAVRLVVDYLFATKKQHRIHLVIVPENGASRRIAEKCGFQLEGMARGAFFNDGRNQHVVIYSLLRTDPRPWRSARSADRVEDAADAPAATTARASTTDTSAST